MTPDPRQTPQQPRGLSVTLRWLGLLALSALFVAVLELAHLPAAFLLGPMLAAILLAAFGKTVQVPKRLGEVAQAMIGVMIAQSIPLAILGEIARDWPLFVAGVVSVIVAAASLGWLLARLKVLPGTTAIWGSMPGAASAMVIMSESFGADMRLVAFMQYLRVVCVAMTASLVARIWVGTSAAALPDIVWFPPLAWTALTGTALLILVSLVATRLLAIPAGIFLLPLIGGIGLQATGLMQLDLPPWLLAASYGLVGWLIGMRFTRPILLHAARALPRVLASIFALILLCALFAAGLVHFAGIDPFTAYLATSPGGADSVAIISASSHVDVPFVMAMQLARFLVILLVGPALARLVVRWSGITDDPRPR